MKVENIDKVQRLADELRTIDKAIVGAEVMLTEVKSGSSGIVFREHTDGSGAFDIRFIWVNQEYPKDAYTRIAEVTLEEFKKLRANIIKEIEAL